MSGGFSPSKVSDLLGKEPETVFKISKVEDVKGKTKTRIPFLNFKILNTKSGRFDISLVRDNGVVLNFGVQDMADIDRDKLEYTWDEKKKERKWRISKSEAPGLVSLIQENVKHIQESYKREIPEKADEIEKYFHRGDTDDLESEKRDWPLKWRSTESYDENGKKGPGKQYTDADGNPDPKLELRFKFAGNPDDKWPVKFPIESFRGRPQETEFLNYETVRLEGTKIVYDPLMIDGQNVNPQNLHRALPRGVKIHEIDIFVKSGGYSSMDAGSPFIHFWVTRCVVELPPPSDFDNNASPEEVEQIKEIMRARAAKAATDQPPAGDQPAANEDAKKSLMYNM